MQGTKYNPLAAMRIKRKGPADSHAMQQRTPWACALELDNQEKVVSGSEAILCKAIRGGADLRVYTEFTFEEHIAPEFGLEGDHEHDGLIQEVIDFRQTFLVDGNHVAGVTTTRQPMNTILGFNSDQPKMSLFMYNMTGHQACASLSLDIHNVLADQHGTYELVPTSANMPKMSETHVFDAGSMCPSRNFFYHMENYRFWVKDDWSEVLATDEDGIAQSGSWDALADAHRNGREVKVAISGLCRNIDPAGPEAEVFSLLGSGFIHTGKKLYEAQTHPIVRVAPAIPMGYGSGNWDVTWVIVRTDGSASVRCVDPRTRRSRDSVGNFPCRWFVR